MKKQHACPDTLDRPELALQGTSGVDHARLQRILRLER
jgi:hypothetical protein